MSFRLNHGYYFQRPYESQYAQIRRFLIANYGVPYANLKRELSKQTSLLDPPTSGTINRLNLLSVKPNPYYYQRWLPKNRGCPECAKSLYHTDIYTYSWLTKCPIHNYVLTDNCPKCKQPWPNLYDLEKRTCEVCGIVSTTQLVENNIKPIPESKFEIIKSLYRFVSFDNSSYYLSSSSNFGSIWINAPESDSCFPSFRIKTKTRLSYKKLLKLGVKLSSVRLKTSILSQRSYDDVHKYSNENLPWKPEVICKTLNAIYKRLVQLSHKHSVSISDYRYLRLKNNHDSDNDCPCPYCMALSLWFINSQTSPNRFLGNFDASEYQFLKQLRYPALYKAFPKIFLHTLDDIYETSLPFQKCSYQRDLEISFIKILSICLTLYKCWGNFRLVAGVEMNNIEQFSTHIKHFDQQFICKKGSKLFFYYRGNSPLDDLIEKVSDQTNICCHNNRKIINKFKDQYKNFLDIQINAPISENEYSNMVDCLQNKYTSSICLLFDRSRYF